MLIRAADINSETLRDWVQIVGTFGVITLLIFVGLLVKQNHKIALSSSCQARAQLVVDINVAESNTPDLRLEGISYPLFN